MTKDMAQGDAIGTQSVTESQASIWANAESQPIEPIIWGRLYGKKIKIKSMGTSFKVVHTIPSDNFDLSVENFKVGRGETNNLCLSEESMDAGALIRVSKVHFEISREQSDISKPVYIKDLSRNGTHVNGELIGINKKRILQNDDVISLVHPNYKAFVFKDLGPNNTQGVPQDICNKYYISTKLGSGACGFVRLVYDRRTCVEYAMKQVKKAILSDYATLRNISEPCRVLNEALIMKRLEHPCVIKMHDIVDKPDSVYMILEFMKGGDLLSRIVSRRRLSERISKLFFYQMSHAVKYLHDQGITHRDLKPDNVLLASHDEETLLKVSDFGLSKFVNNDSVMKTLCGTPLYVAPEVLITGGRGTYTKKVDVWSLGVVLFTCISGTLPFCEEYGSPVAEQIKKGDFNFSHSSWRSVSPHVKDLLTLMLTVDHNQRPSIDYVLQHKWLQDSEVSKIGRRLMGISAPTANCDTENFLEPPVKRRKC